MRKVITEILSNHEDISIVSTAQNGKEAIEVVRKLKPDVLILDLVMPEMSGIEALKIIISEFALPVIILSAINPQMMDASMQALLIGAFDYIIKPGGIESGDLHKFKQEVLFKVLLASHSKIQKQILKKNKEFQERSYLRQEHVSEAFKFGQYLNRVIPASTDDDILEEWEDKVTKQRSEEKILELLKKDEFPVNPSLRQDLVSKIFQKGLQYSKESKLVEESESQSAPSVHYGINDVIKKITEKTLLDKEITIKPITPQRKEKSYQKATPKIKRRTIEDSTFVKPELITDKKSVPKKISLENIPALSSITLKPKNLSPIPLPKATLKSQDYSLLIDYNIIVIGASVGGPKTITNICKSLTEDVDSPIVIVQHLNADFINIFVKTLNNFSRLPIKSTENGEFLEKGVIYIAPGNKHTELTIVSKRPYLRTFVGTPINFFMPSIDVLFKSAASLFKHHIMGILLTGMGEDGVQGLEHIKCAGGVTIAESEETAILYGMPKNAIEKGFVDYVLPYYDIPSYITRFSREIRN